jgi:hypothetical protein
MAATYPGVAHDYLGRRSAFYILLFCAVCCIQAPDAAHLRQQTIHVLHCVLFAVQAVGKEGAASRRLMLHISANKPYTGSLEAFQNISEAHCAATDDDGAGSDASGKTAATAAPTRVQRSSATGAWGVRMQEPVKATAAVSRTGPAAAAGRKVGAHFAADYDGAMTDDMAADLAADIGDGNASQHSGSDEQQQQQRQPARGSGRGVHASPRFVPGGGNTASRAAARIGSGPGAAFAQWEGAGRSSRVPPRQPANVRLAAAADEDEDGSWQGSEAGRAAEDGDGINAGSEDGYGADGAALLGRAGGRGRGESSAPLHGQMALHASRQYGGAAR